MKKLLKYFFYCILILDNCYCLAQQSKTDSLKKNLLSAKEDTSKVNALNELANIFSSSNPDTSLALAQKALTLAEKLKSKKHIANSYYNIARTNYLKGNYPASIEYYLSALKIREELNDKLGISKSLGSIGIVFRNQGDYPKALDYYFRALKINEELGDKNQIAIWLGNIGIIYSDQADYPKALHYYFKRMELDEESGNKNNMAINLGNIGSVYFKQAESHANPSQKEELFNKALDYYFKALKMREELGAKNLIATTLGNIGNVYDEQAASPLTTLQRSEELQTKALDYYFRALKINEELGKKIGIANILGNIGSLYTTTGKFKEAEKYLKRALALADSIGYLEATKEFNQDLSQLYDTTGRYQLAFTHYKKYISAHDSITNDENTKKQTRLEMNYEFEKKEAVAKAEQQKKDAIAMAEAKRQKIIRNSIASGLAVVLLFSLIVYRQRNRIAREKKRSDELLHNILPAETAEELKLTGHAEPKQFDRVTVLFTDFKGFTQIAENLSANELVGELNFLFSKFDEIISKYPIEKIKTIGDAYMCAGGLPTANNTNAMDVTLAALEIQDFMQSHNAKQISENKPVFGIRIGIHTGPIVAGIVGIKKFAYDIWGDTVNTASRMESSGEADKVNISGTTYELVKDKIKCIYRGKIQAKNKGEIEMYFAEA